MQLEPFTSREKEKTNMFKVILLLSALAAFAASASVKINPEELYVIWDTIQKDVIIRQTEAELEIRNVLPPLHILVDDAKEKLVKDISEASLIYHEEIGKLEAEAQAHGKDISRCIQSADEELQQVDDELLISHFEIYERLENEAEQEVDRAILVTTNILNELEVLRGRVEACSNVECASELDVEIVEFYERIIKDLEGAIEIANEAALIKLAIDLDEAQLNRERYGEEIEKLLTEVKRCAN